MRLVVASVIGTLATINTFRIHKANPAALAATVFVPPEEELKMAPSAGAVATLTEILRWVRVRAATGQDAESPLRLSAAARKTLEQAKAKLVRASNEVLPPLADYYAGVADLLTRIVDVLHVLDHACAQGRPGFG